MDTVLVVLLFSLCYFTLMPYTAARKDYLYFASPGSLSPFLHSGLYGGPVKYQQGGNATGIYRYGFTCAQLGAHSVQGFKIQDISYDLKMAEVLLSIGEHGDNGLTLLKGNLCAGDHGCPNHGLDVVFRDVTLQHKIVAFAIHRGEIYFVSEKIIAISATEKNKKIELRRLTHCNLGNHNITYPFKPSSPFKVERCSTLISLVIHETYKHRSSYHITSGLAIVPVDGNRLVFFMQVEQRLYKDNLPESISNAMVLYRVRQGHSPSKVHEEYIGNSHTNFIIDSLGQITYRFGILCWSALDRIVCGRMDNRGRLSNAVNVLYKNDVRKVCQAPPGAESRLISTIVTGVAIAKVPENINRDEIVLYFGCYAQIRGLGGAGLLKKRGRSSAEIHPLTNGTSRIYAGSMFMTTACSGPDGEHVKVARVMSGTQFQGGSTFLLVLLSGLSVVLHYINCSTLH